MKSFVVLAFIAALTANCNAGKSLGRPQCLNHGVCSVFLNTAVGVADERLPLRHPKITIASSISRI